MILFLLALIALIAVFPVRDTSVYNRFCKEECWSKRHPCCRAV
jgi:hypothetical protein